MPSLAASFVFVTVIGIGAFVAAVTGFGFALLAAPVAAAIVGPRAGIGLVTAVGILMNLGMSWSLRDDVDRPAVGRVLGGAVLGMPIGLVALTQLPATTLKIGIALAVLASVLVLWRTPHLHHVSSRTDVAAGFVSGALAASVGANGPPVVLAQQARQLPPHRLRATLSACFLSINVTVFVLLMVTGELHWDVMPLVVWSVPAMGVGYVAGAAIKDRIPIGHFRPVCLALLAASAVLSIVLALS